MPNRLQTEDKSGGNYCIVITDKPIAIFLLTQTSIQKG